MLAVVFTELEAFCREFHENLTKGGIFVQTEEVVELRSRVEVGLDLQFCCKFIVLEGEVVHCVPLELASAGAVPGVAVQFDRSVADLREAFEALVGSIPDPKSVPEQDVQAQASRPLTGVERREEPRYTARVVARVCDSKGELVEGMTRNLSVSGILFSVVGEPLAIGEKLVVTLSNSISRENLEIPAEVMRHLEGEDGDVPAVGIRFSPDEGSREKTRGFLGRLRDTEHTRRLGGISGDIQELGLASLLQSFGVSSEEGTITLIRDNQEGYIAFCRGALVATRIGRVTGAKALARLLRWESGHFEFHARIDSQIVRDPPVHLEAAILAAMNEIGESNRSSSSHLAPKTQFELASDGIAGLGGDLGKIECAIIDLVGVGASLRKLLDVIPEPDARIHDALTTLIEQGALAPIAPEA